jgi:CHAD domain-containing protein
MGKRVGELEGEERHKMRKSPKKLRYIVKYFGSLYRPADVKPFVKQLKKLQDVFASQDRAPSPLTTIGCE